MKTSRQIISDEERTGSSDNMGKQMKDGILLALVKKGLVVTMSIIMTAVVMREQLKL